jgi:hypothetical protein
MIHEAEVFVLADQAVLRTVRQIHDADWERTLPPIFDMPGADLPRPLREVVNHHAYDDAWVPDLLAGRTMEEAGKDKFDGDLLGADPVGAVARIVTAACDAAQAVEDRDAPVHCSYGDCPTWDYFWQLNIARTLGAHEIARLIGAEPPLTEELAQAMYEGTAPSADMWRSFGIYRPEVAVPADADWRTRYLALTGRAS